MNWPYFVKHLPGCVSSAVSWVGLFRRPPVDGLPNRTVKSATLFLFISSWFIFLGFIDNHFNGPAWCVTPIRPFICNGTSLRYLTLKGLGFRQGGGIAYANLFRETSEQEEMKFIFNTNKNKQRRRLWVSRGSRSGYSAAKLFSVNCAYFMNVTRKRQ